MWFRLALVLAATSLTPGCATTPSAELVHGSLDNECVVLLHGLNRSARAMNEMAEALQKGGYSTANTDYCRETGADTIHFVTHSMGGILLRYRQQQDPIPELGRVVMLGPPNRGSEIVDEFRDWGGATEIITGPAGMQLGTGEDGVPAGLGPVDFELGIIAGVGSINPWLSAVLPGYDDGTVTVESTRLPGMTDFMIVDSSHSFLMNSQTVIRNTIAFLQTGSFPRIR
jgi:triacylglycerol lipase